MITLYYVVADIIMYGLCKSHELKRNKPQNPSEKKKLFISLECFGKIS